MHRLIAYALILAVLLIPLESVWAVGENAPAGEPSSIAFQMGVGLYWAQTAVLQIMGYTAQLFDVFARYSVNANIPVIQTTWGLIRNFTNMFFILIIIILAFGVIFNIGGYNDLRGLLVRLIVVAVLINFSLSLGGLVIRGFDLLNGVFLSGLGNMSARLGQVFSASAVLGSDGASFAQSIAAVLGTNACLLTGVELLGVNCSSFAGSLAGVNPELLTWAMTMRLLATLVLTVWAAMGLLFSTIFIIVRAPFLWFLLIFSPLAGLLSILPATRSTWDRWLKEFLGWNLFLPIYLFFLYFGMYFLAQQDLVLTGLRQFPNQYLDGHVPGLGLTIQFVYFYVLAGLILFAATGIALSLSRAGGTMAAKGVEWSRSASSWLVSRPYKWTPAETIVKGAREGIDAERERIRQEGFGKSGYFGKLRQERTRAGTAELFGATGARQEAYKKQADYFADRYKKENRSSDDLRGILKTGNTYQRLGALKRLKDEKDLSPEELKGAYFEFARYVGPAAAESFVSGIDFKKDFSKFERIEWFKDEKLNSDIRRKVARVMAEEGELEVKWDGKEKIQDDLETAAKLFMSPENRRFIESGAQGPIKWGVSEENGIRDFLAKSSEKKLVESYKLLSNYAIRNPSHKDGSAYNLGDDLERELAKKGAKDFSKLLTGLYDAKENRMKELEELDLDKQLLFKTLKTVLGKRDRGALKKFLKSAYNNWEASPEQLGAIKKFAEDLKINVEGKDEEETSEPPKQRQAGFHPGPDGSLSSSKVSKGNVIDLRNT